MYDLISQIINHDYINNYSGDQSYIYYVCSVIICLFAVVFLDYIYRIFRHFWR